VIYIGATTGNIKAPTTLELKNQRIFTGDINLRGK